MELPPSSAEASAWLASAWLVRLVGLAMRRRVLGHPGAVAGVAGQELAGQELVEPTVSWPLDSLD